MNAEQRAVFQGIVYYYRENQVLCRYQATLKEAVDLSLLQQALDAARPLAEYYFCHVVWEKREARLEPNTAPCRVRQGSAQPKIPEETNDYLFSLGYEGNTVYLDWFHFLADGRGSAPFFTLLLKLYCNLRSNAGFVCEALASDPPYDVEQLLARCLESQAANNMQKDVLQIHEGTPHFQRLRLDRQSLVNLAQKEGVKPFSALMGLTCQAAQRYLEKNNLVYSYAADTRAALGVPHALYNCIASFQLSLQLEPQARFHSFAKRLRGDIVARAISAGQARVGLDEHREAAGQGLGQPLCHGEDLLGAKRAVDTHGIGPQAPGGGGKALDRAAGKGAAACFKAHAGQHGQAAVLLDGQQGGLQLIQIGKGLKEHEVSPGGHACPDDAAILCHGILKRKGAVGFQQLPQRPHIQRGQCTVRGTGPLAVGNARRNDLLQRVLAARQLVGGSAKGIGIDDAAACGGVPGMDALDERRVGDVQLLGAGPQFQARCLQHGAHAAIQQDGIGPVKQFIRLHR